MLSGEWARDGVGPWGLCRRSFPWANLGQAATKVPTSFFMPGQQKRHCRNSKVLDNPGWAVSYVLWLHWRTCPLTLFGTNSCPAGVAREPGSVCKARWTTAVISQRTGATTRELGRIGSGNPSGSAEWNCRERASGLLFLVPRKSEVKAVKIEGPPGLTWIQTLGLLDVFQVLVVCPHKKRM